MESFNHLINQCLDSNTKASVSKFEEILKYIFIRMNSYSEINDSNKERYSEKTLISDFLRELISNGYGKNGKIITNTDLKKFKKLYLEENAFHFTFIKDDKLDN